MCFDEMFLISTQNIYCPGEITNTSTIIGYKKGILSGGTYKLSKIHKIKEKYENKPFT